LLRQVAVASELASSLVRDYDAQHQAEHALADAATLLEPLFPSPLGPAVLRGAVEAARAGRPVPWSVLANFRVTTETLAPPQLFDSALRADLRHHFLELACHMTTADHVPSNLALLRRLRDALEDFAMRENWSPVPSSASWLRLNTLRSDLAWLIWCAACDEANFAYDNAYHALKNLWSERPSRIQEDVNSVRQQLRAALV